MKKMTRNVLLVLLGFFMVFSSTAIAATIDVDLNDFFLDSFIGTDTIATDGSSATLYEDDILINDPYAGYELGIAVPANLLSLDFSYDFNEYDNDEFYAWLFDGDTGNEIEFWYIDASETGAYSFDLSTLDPSITLLGLEFGITPNGDLGTQSALISDVQLVTADVAPVPEPATIFLFGIGLLGVAGISRKQ